MTADREERTVIALERIGTGLLRLAAAAEKAVAPPPAGRPEERAPAPDVDWVTTTRRRWRWPGR